MRPSVRLPMAPRQRVEPQRQICWLTPENQLCVLELDALGERGAGRGRGGKGRG